MGAEHRCEWWPGLDNKRHREGPSSETCDKSREIVFKVLTLRPVSLVPGAMPPSRFFESGEL